MTAKAKRVDLTLDDLEAGYDSEDWGGYGYLGTRRDGMGTKAGRATVEQADARLLRIANEQRWTPADLFTYTDSKAGRWYAEACLHTSDSEERLLRLIVKAHG